MTRSSRGIAGLPAAQRRMLAGVGAHLRMARRRRGWTMADMAARMLVTRKTLKRLEDGDPGTSIGVLAAALMVLGMDGDLASLADPDRDTVASAMERRQTAEKMRTRQPAETVDLDF